MAGGKLGRPVARETTSRASSRRSPGWPDEIPPLRRGRAHEAFGPSARAFAAAVAGAGLEPGRPVEAVVWIRMETRDERLDGDGLSAFFDPGRLIEVAAHSAQDVQWAAEESLRSGAAVLTIAELPRGLDLTPSRRLQLAAEAGGETGLILTAEQTARANAVETRWRVSPAPSWALGGSEAPPVWRWELVKNKRGSCGGWRVRWRPPDWRELARDALRWGAPARLELA